MRHPAAWMAAFAIALSAAALTMAIGNRPAPDRYTLVCSETFRAATGHPFPVYYPCTPDRP